MNVLVLGDTPQERGLQLEELTKKVLEHLEYKNFSLREISSGGHEIDLYCERELGQISRPQTIGMICECKAHEKPINTTDWLKFLGKVYLENVNSKNMIYGCFISLSGVNGNVAGSYKKLKEENHDVELVSGEALYKALMEIYSNPTQERNTRLVGQQTNRKILGLTLAYYESSLYWVFSLEGDVYTVMNESGENLKIEDKATVLLSERVSGLYLDLAQEKERIETEKTTESAIYSSLAVSDGSLNKDVLFEAVQLIFEKSNLELSLDLYKAVQGYVLEQPFVSCTEDSVAIDISTVEKKIQFIRRAFSVIPSVNLLSSNFYTALIDDELLDEIEVIQGNLKLDDEARKICLKTLVASPSALNLALNEIQLITTHRKDISEVDKRMDEYDRALLLKLIVEKFTQDYQGSYLTDYYFSNMGFEELDMSISVKIKSKTNIYLEHESRQRLGIGRMTESEGGQLVRVLKLNDMPEPWEIDSLETGDV